MNKGHIEIKESVWGKSASIKIIKNHEDVDNRNNATQIYDFLQQNVSAGTYEELATMIKRNMEKMEPFNEYLKKSVANMGKESNDHTKESEI